MTSLNSFCLASSLSIQIRLTYKNVYSEILWLSPQSDENNDRHLRQGEPLQPDPNIIMSLFGGSSVIYNREKLC